MHSLVFLPQPTLPHWPDGHIALRTYYVSGTRGWKDGRELLAQHRGGQTQDERHRKEPVLLGGSYLPSDFLTVSVNLFAFPQFCG